MKIAIDVSPLQTGHRIRGIGFYLKNLKESLLEYYPENKYIFFTKSVEIPSDTDLVHYPYFDPFFITLPIKKKHKTIVTVHDLTPLVFPRNFPAGLKGKAKWQMQKFLLNKTDAIITDSQSSKEDLLKYAGIEENKIDVIYLAAGEEFKKTENIKFDIEINNKYKLPEKFALYVGDVTWNKNLPRLVRAATKINIPLVMVGSALVKETFDRTNPWNQDLLETQELIKNNRTVQAVGFVPGQELVELYNLATVCVMPSIYEGFGLPVLEAMQSGCPVVTSKEGSLAEVAGQAAFYVDPTNIDSIASGMEKVFENRMLQLELSEKGLEQAKKFTWKKTAEQTMETYKKVLGI